LSHGEPTERRAIRSARHPQRDERAASLDQSPITRSPAAVILMRATSIVRPPAMTRSALAVASLGGDQLDHVRDREPLGSSAGATPPLRASANATDMLVLRAVPHLPKPGMVAASRRSIAMYKWHLHRSSAAKRLASSA